MTSFSASAKPFATIIQSFQCFSDVSRYSLVFNQDYSSESASISFLDQSIGKLIGDQALAYLIFLSHVRFSIYLRNLLLYIIFIFFFTEPAFH